MKTDQIDAFLAIVLPVVVGLATFYLATRATRTQAKAAQTAVDADAYARAREIYEGALNTLRDELASTRVEMHELRESNVRLTAELESVRHEWESAKISNNGLRAEVNSLHAEIGRLRRTLAEPRRRRDRSRA